jgi:hypothetical protein
MRVVAEDKPSRSKPSGNRLELLKFVGIAMIAVMNEQVNGPFMGNAGHGERAILNEQRQVVAQPIWDEPARSGVDINAKEATFMPLCLISMQGL